MEGRHQRRALAAGGDVAAAEVGDGGDAGAFGDDVAVAELQRERAAVAPLRAVAHGLAVRADRAHLAGVDAGFVEQLRCAASAKACADPHVERAELVERTARRRPGRARPARARSASSSG